jgi:hypothetical protein
VLITLSIFATALAATFGAARHTTKCRTRGKEQN